MHGLPDKDMELKRVQKVPVFCLDIALSIFFGAYLNFLRTHFCICPHRGLSCLASAPGTTITLVSHSPGKGGMGRRTSNTQPPSFPSQKQTITWKRKYRRQKRIQYLFPFDKFWIDIGLDSGCQAFGVKPAAPKGLCSLGSRLCSWLKVVPPRSVKPIKQDGEAAAVSSPGSCAAFSLLPSWDITSRNDPSGWGWRGRGGMERGTTDPKATGCVALSAQHTGPPPRFMLKVQLAKDICQRKIVMGNKINVLNHKPFEFHFP